MYDLPVCQSALMLIGCAGLLMLNLFAIALSTSHNGIMDIKRNRRDMCANQKCLRGAEHGKLAQPRGCKPSDQQRREQVAALIE